jgi:hypothetical protein
MPLSLRAVILALLLPALPAAADGVIASYGAYIDVDDLYNSDGERLSAPWQVLRQDRANYHRYGIAQPGDEWDPVFHDLDARAALERLLRQGSISPAAARIIMRGDALVYVTIWGNGLNATWVDVITWEECAC